MVHECQSNFLGLKCIEIHMFQFRNLKFKEFTQPPYWNFTKVEENRGLLRKIYLVTFEMKLIPYSKNTNILISIDRGSSEINFKVFVSIIRRANKNFCVNKQSKGFQKKSVKFDATSKWFFINIIFIVNLIWILSCFA